MGIFSSSKENEKEQEQDKKEEKNENKLDLSKSKSLNNSLRSISNNYPIKEKNPIILSNDIYYNLNHNLGKKRLRNEIYNEVKNINKKEEISKKENKNKNIYNNLLNIEKKNDILSKWDKIINNKIEENIKENQKNLLINEENINNCLKDIKDENEKKYKTISKKYDEMIERNDALYKKMKKLFHKTSEEIREKDIKIISLKEKNKEYLNSLINLEEDKSDENFSFICLTKNLKVKGFQGVSELSLNIVIKNNGENDWNSNNIFLLCNKDKSDIIAEDIKLNPLKSQSICTAKIEIKYLNLIFPSIYNVYMNFFVNGKKYGDELKIEVEILKKINQEKKTINTLIEEMRKEYNIPKTEKDDNTLKNSLINNNNNKKKAFEYLFNN